MMRSCRYPGCLNKFVTFSSVHLSSSLAPRTLLSPFVTPAPYAQPPCCEHVCLRDWKLHISVYKVLRINIFLKCIFSLQKAFNYSLWSSFMMYGSFSDPETGTIHCNYTDWNRQDNVENNSECVCLKEECQKCLGCPEGD